jgi:hypothetical protein
MADLIPGEVLIYERVDGVVYARYRDPPHNAIPRWVIGGPVDSTSRAMGNLFSFSEWQDMMRLAQENQTFRKELDKLLTLYYICKKEE